MPLNPPGACQLRPAATQIHTNTPTHKKTRNRRHVRPLQADPTRADQVPRRSAGPRRPGAYCSRTAQGRGALTATGPTRHRQRPVQLLTATLQPPAHTLHTHPHRLSRSTARKEQRANRLPCCSLHRSLPPAHTLTHCKLIPTDCQGQLQQEQRCIGQGAQNPGERATGVLLEGGLLTAL